MEQWKPDSHYHFIYNYAECIDGFVYYKYKSEELDTSDSVLWQNMFTEKFSIIKNNLSGINRDIGLLNLSQEFTRFLSVPENNFHKQAEIVNNYFVLNKQAEQYYSLFKQNYLGFMEIAPSKKATSSGFLIDFCNFKCFGIALMHGPHQVPQKSI